MGLSGKVVPGKGRGEGHGGRHTGREGISKSIGIEAGNLMFRKLRLLMRVVYKGCGLGD